VFDSQIDAKNGAEIWAITENKIFVKIKTERKISAC
jgi:hypothetical protein